MNDFSSIVITGASSGIGEALALDYARPGAALALTGRDAGRLEAVAQACRAKGATVVAVTRAPNSPLGQLADAVFPLAAEETAFNTEAMASRLAALALLDSLFVLVAMQEEARTNASLKRILDVQTRHQTPT